MTYEDFSYINEVIFRWTLINFFRPRRQQGLQINLTLLKIRAFQKTMMLQTLQR